MFLNQMEEMLLTSRSATSRSVWENTGEPSYLPGLISFKHFMYGHEQYRVELSTRPYNDFDNF